MFPPPFGPKAFLSVSHSCSDRKKLHLRYALAAMPQHHDQRHRIVSTSRANRSRHHSETETTIGALGIGHPRFGTPPPSKNTNKQNVFCKKPKNTRHICVYSVCVYYIRRKQQNIHTHTLHKTNTRNTITLKSFPKLSPPHPQKEMREAQSKGTGRRNFSTPGCCWTRWRASTCEKPSALFPRTGGPSSSK